MISREASRGTEPGRVNISRHALDRWRQHVAPETSIYEAAQQLGSFVDGAVLVERPPAWLRSVAGEARVLLNPSWPLVAGVVIPRLVDASVLVTILTKQSVAEARPRPALLTRPLYRKTQRRRFKPSWQR